MFSPIVVRHLRRYLQGYLALSILGFVLGLGREVILEEGCISERRSRLSSIFPSYEFGCYLGEAQESRKAMVWKEGCRTALHDYSGGVDGMSAGHKEEWCDRLYRENILGEFKERIQQ